MRVQPFPSTQAPFKPVRWVLPLLAATCWSLPAQAMINQVTYSVQYDGTPTFNTTRTGPGFDAGAKNGIVRTHDAVGYEVAVSTNGADTNPVIKLTLPQVNGKPIADWSMPTQCRQPGSQLSADGQIITCRMEDFTGSGTRSLVFNATVRGDVRHDTTFETPAIDVKSDKVPAGKAPATLPDALKVTAAPFYDVKVQMSHNGVPAAYGVQVENGPGPGPERKDGVFHRPMIGLFAQNPDKGGKKGVEQLDPNQPVEITLDISGYPDSVRVLDWDPDAKGSYADGCGSGRNFAQDAPGLFGGGRVNTYNRVTDHGPSPAPDKYTVANGGDCQVKPGATRNAVTISLSGVDTRLAHYPTQLSRTNSPLPADEFWVANKVLVLWTELATYPDNVVVNHPFRFAQIQGTSISGQAIAQPKPNLEHDRHVTSHDIKAQGKGEAQKAFVPDTGVTAPLHAPKDPAILSDEIVNHIAPTQSVRSILRFSNTGTQQISEVLLCDILDRSAFDVDVNRLSASILPGYLKDPKAVIKYSYGVPPAGTSPYFASTDTSRSPYEVIGQYSSHGSSAYSSASCQNPDIQWFDTAQKAEEAGKLVYVRAQLNRLNPQGIAVLNIPGLVMRRTWGSTIEVLSPSPATRRAGDEIPDGTIVRNRAEITSTSFPMDVTKQRDHLMVIPTRTVSRVSKTIIEPAAANDEKTPVPAGSVLTYEIVPRHSTLYPQLRDTVTVTDLLPKGTYYLEGTATVGGQPMEPVVQENTPDTGMTTLTWTFPDQLPHFGHDGDEGAKLPPITFRARLSNHLINGSQVRNLVAISGGANDYEGDCRYHAGSQTWVMTRLTDNQEVVCEKGAYKNTTVQTPPGFLLEKSTSRTRIEPGDPFDYTLTFVSMGQEISAPNVPDMIDVLPFVGDGESRPALSFTARHPASSFEPGAYQLVSITPPARDATAKIYYTNRNPKDIHNDPRDASNALTGGSTRWCLASEFGTEGCPAAIGESTAIRISPSLRLLQANIPYEVKVSLQSDPLKSHDGNIFANHVDTRPPDESSPLLYVESQSDLHVRIVRQMSGLSGRVFVDGTQDNVFDTEDTALPGQCVRLSGTNSKGQPVTLSRHTDEHGHFAFTPDQKHQIYTSEDCSGTPLTTFGGLLDGTYTLSRVSEVTKQPGKTHAGSAGGQVSADGRSIAQITLGTGDMATGYHFTESRLTPRLTLVSTLTNDHGGQRSVSDIQLSAARNGQGDSTLNGSSGTPSVTLIQVPTGPYVLNATPLPGYRAGSWQCTVNGQPVPHGAASNASTPGESEVGAAPAPYTLNLGHDDDAVCAIHYDDEPARLTLTTTVTNSHGGKATPQHFVLHADGPTPMSGTTGQASVTGVSVLPGTYALRQDELPKYVASVWECDAGTLDGHQLSLAQGEHATCTISNTDQPISLTLVLDVLNSHGGTATSRDTTVGAQGPDHAISGITGTRPVTVAPVRPGTYRLEKPSLPGYLTGKWVCSEGTLEDDLLTLHDHQNVICHIELKDIPATLKAVKEVVGEPQPVPGTPSDYQVQYRVSVKHEAGAAGLYSLIDTPAFDPDVKIIGTRILKNDRPLSVTAANDGSWALAEQQPLAIGAEDLYLMDFQIRVPYGSSTANNRCASTEAAEGKGLFNRLSLRNHSADTPDAAPLTSQACIDTPVPADEARLTIEKRGNTQAAELGDLVTYQLRIRNQGTGPAISPVVVDRLPPGFRLEPGSVRVQGAQLVEIRQQGMRELRLTLDRIEGTGTDATAAAKPGATNGRNRTGSLHTGNFTSHGQGSGSPSLKAPGQHQPGDVIITYRVRLGVGSLEGDGTNRVHVECLTPNGAGTSTCSNESRWKVQVRAGIFSEEACVAGQVFVDCNGNAKKDVEELGIPGVRLYLQNGTWMVTDAHGKYSHCGLRPRTHVLKIDGRTLPRRSRLVTSSAQSAGDAQSLFIDAKKGMLHRADFIEGSCSNTVIEQVKARQAQGENTSVQTETGQPALSFESKRGVPARPLHQGTDAASQAVSRTRH
ncbi:MAG: hypothetical protein Q4B17_06875 [Lautropia sp.]|nr:hypothetical protein [Lautropia sp.]